MVWEGSGRIWEGSGFGRVRSGLGFGRAGSTKKSIIPTTGRFSIRVPGGLGEGLLRFGRAMRDS